MNGRTCSSCAVGRRLNYVRLTDNSPSGALLLLLCLPKARTSSTKLVLIGNALTHRFVNSGLRTQRSNQKRMESVSLTYLLHPPAYGLRVSLLQLSGPSSLTGPEFGIWHISDTIYPCQPRGEIPQRSNRNLDLTLAPPQSLCAKTVTQETAWVKAFPATKYPDLLVCRIYAPTLLSSLGLYFIIFS